MRIALIADAFPPMRSSAAVQLRDLAREFVNQGHHITVFVPSAALGADWVLENGPGIDILRLKSPPTKDVSHVRRVLGEWLMPYRMLRNFKRSNVSSASWDGVVWYAPSIFWGPLVKALKQRCGCRSYLIVRDIFPEWAVDMGLLRRGMLYHFFKMIERQQYSQADTIGVQTQGNIPYLQKESTARSCRLEVLQNWLAPAVVRQCPIRIDATPLRGVLRAQAGQYRVFR
jgi:glycosyltransferase involved in cell wall biosynthesis